MKKVLMVAAMMLLSAGAFAQEVGKMAAGVQASYGMHKDYKNFGIGAKFQYNITDRFRGEASGNYFFKKDYVSMWDINANVHYVFPLTAKLNAYPLVGLTVMGAKFNASDIYDDLLAQTAAALGMTVAQYREYCAQYGIDLPSGSDFEENETKLGFNAGVGIEYLFSDTLKGFFEFKYQFVKDLDRPVISAGVAYIF
jgi:outer membrane protein X